MPSTVPNFAAWSLEESPMICIRTWYSYGADREVLREKSINLSPVSNHNHHSSASQSSIALASSAAEKGIWFSLVSEYDTKVFSNTPADESLTDPVVVAYLDLHSTPLSKTINSDPPGYHDRLSRSTYT